MPGKMGGWQFREMCHTEILSMVVGRGRKGLGRWGRWVVQYKVIQKKEKRD